MTTLTCDDGRLMVEIKGTPYTLRLVAAPHAAIQFALVKQGAESGYLVTLHGDGRYECECADSRFRPRPGGCKHCRCVADLMPLFRAVEETLLAEVV